MLLVSQCTSYLLSRNFINTASKQKVYLSYEHKCNPDWSEHCLHYVYLVYIESNKGKEQAGTIISQAQKRGDEIVEEARDLAKKEGERIKESAISEIEQEKEKARQDLRNQVAALAITGAEQILMREVDHAAHNEVLTKISQKL